MADHTAAPSAAQPANGEEWFSGAIAYVEDIETRQAAGEIVPEEDLVAATQLRSFISTVVFTTAAKDNPNADVETIYSSGHDREIHEHAERAIRRRYQRPDGTWRPRDATARAPKSPASKVRVTRRGARRESHATNRGHATTRSSARSGDSGSDDGSAGDAEPPSRGRRCAACGADISNRRAGARTCDALCRKRLSRGASPAEPSRPAVHAIVLEDEIAAKAWERHLAWATDVHASIRDELTRELEELYAQLRLRRGAKVRLGDFQGSSRSVVTLPAPPLRREWRTKPSREAVAA
jgi:hypothetical protein